MCRRVVLVKNPWAVLPYFFSPVHEDLSKAPCSIINIHVHVIRVLYTKIRMEYNSCPNCVGETNRRYSISSAPSGNRMSDYVVDKNRQFYSFFDKNLYFICSLVILCLVHVLVMSSLMHTVTVYQECHNSKFGIFELLVLPWMFPFFLFLLVFCFLKCNLSFFLFFRFYFYWSHRSMINTQCTCH